MALLREQDDNNVSIDVGDIVKIDGYIDRLFEIISVEKRHYKDCEQEYVITEYEALGITDRRNYIAAEDDVTLVEKGDKDDGKAENKALDKSERIDELLTHLNDVNGLIAMFGEHEDEDRRDRRYVLMKAEIEAELLELTGGPRE